MDRAVYYFDLGLHRGLEIDKFLFDTEGLPCTVCVHGVEAHPSYAEGCRSRFADDPRVTIHNFAVGSEDGSIEFYLEPTGYSCSIYADKSHVTKQTRRVVQRRFSTFLCDLGLFPKPENSVAILKVNIEGAEWDLIRDLDRSNLFGYFDLVCCATADPIQRGRRVVGFGMTRDMCKVPSLNRYVKKARTILQKHIGGIFLVAPTKVYRRFRAPEDRPLARGFDGSICNWMRRRRGLIGYIEELVVNHFDYPAQKQRFPDYWRRKMSEQVTPYRPKNS